MGFRSLIEISHDSFSRLDKDAFFADLERYVNSGDSMTALKLLDDHDVKVISMRSTGQPYYVSNKIDGFPTELPYDEDLDRKNAEWKEAADKAKRLLGGTLKLRTIADLRDVIAKLLTRIS